MNIKISVTVACFLPRWAKDWSAPLYQVLTYISSLGEIWQ